MSKRILLRTLTLVGLTTSLFGADPLAHPETTGQQYTYLTPISKYNNERFSQQIYNAVRPWIKPCTTFEPGSFIQPWFQIEKGVNTSNNDHKMNGVKNDTLDFVLGAHIPFENSTLIGIALAYDDGNIHFKNGGGSSTLKVWQGALYAAASQPEFYAFGDAIFAGSNGHSRRRIQYDLVNETATSSPSAHHGMVYAEFGLNNYSFNALIQPFIAFEFGWNRCNSITESGTGSLDLQVSDKTTKIFDIYLGSHFTTLLGKTVSISADLAWHHRYGTNTFNIQTRFLSGGPCAFVKGTEIGKDAIEGAVTISTTLCNQFTLFAELAGERWSNFSAISLDLGVSLLW